MTEPVVSVLVPILNERRHLPEVLAAMRSQRLDGGIEFLLMDGGSTDGTRAMLDAAAREDPRIRVLDNPGRTTPCALNVGLRHARADYVARMDAHTFYPVDYLAVGLDRLRRGDVASVSGPALPWGTGRWSRRVALALGSPLGVGASAFRRAIPAETEVDASFAGVWRRDFLESLGGWDEGWPINQDGELAGRIRARGGRLVVLPQMAARYVPRDSLPSLGRQYFRYGLYKEKTCRRHPHSLRRSHLLAPALVVVVLSAVIAPPGLRRVARRVTVGYWLVVGGDALRLARTAPPKDAAAVPVVMATMHHAWGAGFLAGCLRFGAPWQAIVRVLAPNPRPRR